MRHVTVAPRRVADAVVAVRGPSLAHSVDVVRSSLVVFGSFKMLSAARRGFVRRERVAGFFLCELVEINTLLPYLTPQATAARVNPIAQFFFDAPSQTPLTEEFLGSVL